MTPSVPQYNRQTSGVSVGCVVIIVCRFSGLLSLTDFDLLYPHQAQFLRQLSTIVAQRRIIEADLSLSDDSKWEKIHQLTVGDSGTNIDDIGFVLYFCIIVINVIVIILLCSILLPECDLPSSETSRATAGPRKNIHLVLIWGVNF